MTSFFITGTDTGCGKTYVTCQLLRYMQAQSMSSIGLKPIASGCEWQNETWFNEDVAQLMQANASAIKINQWQFAEPIAPHFAAFKAGVSMQAGEVVSFCQTPEFMAFEHQLIEGAGGLMVPLNGSQTWIDVIKQGGFSLILVVGMRLGCINHALLTAEVCKLHQLPLRGWIANNLDPAQDLIEEMIVDMQTRLSAPLLAISGYGEPNLNPCNRFLRQLLPTS